MVCLSFLYYFNMLIKVKIYDFKFKALTYSLHFPISFFKWKNTIILKIHKANTPSQYLQYQEAGCELYFFVLER